MVSAARHAADAGIPVRHVEFGVDGGVATDAARCARRYLYPPLPTEVFAVGVGTALARRCTARPDRSGAIGATPVASSERSADVEVLPVDETDSAPNLRVGYDWQPRTAPLGISTSGMNRRHWVAVALYPAPGEVTWAFHERKHCAAFIRLLEILRRACHRARRISLAAKGHGIHKRRKAQR